jgi:Fuc2NAc and GlcNAc transferase
MNLVLLLISCAVASLAIAAGYYRFALRYGPLAMPNYRSLHKKPVPRGAGLAIAASVLAGISVSSMLEHVSFEHWMIYVLGGAVIAVLGVADDRLDLSASVRLPCQIAAAIWIIWWLGGSELMATWFPGLPAIPLASLLVFVTVWFYNAYNFIDGIDGMAGTATIFIGATMGWVLWERGHLMLATWCGLLASGSAAFLVFNWPVAKMFMGEAGSSFISFIFSAVCLESVRADPTVLWYWLLAGAYYFADTTLTTLTRALTVRGWYRPHRSHAYQNLARIWSHRRVLMLVLACDIFWVFPWILLLTAFPGMAAVGIVVVYLPIAGFCFMYGPRFENK